MGAAIAGIGVTLFFYGIFAVSYLGDKVGGVTFIFAAAVVFMLAAILEHENV